MANSEILNKDLSKLTKKELIEYDKKLRREINPKINNFTRLKHAEEKNKFNPKIEKNLDIFEKTVGRYTRGKKAGQLKPIRDSLTKKELLEIARQGKIILRKDIYSEEGRKWKDLSSQKAFEEFKKEKGREDYTKEDFDKLTYLYNVVGKQLVEAYGSETIMQTYETIKESGKEISAHTIADIIQKDIEELGYYRKNDIELANRVFEDILELLDEE